MWSPNNEEELGEGKEITTEEEEDKKWNKCTMYPYKTWRGWTKLGELEQREEAQEVEKGKGEGERSESKRRKTKEEEDDEGEQGMRK